MRQTKIKTCLTEFDLWNKCEVYAWGECWSTAPAAHPLFSGAGSGCLRKAPPKEKTTLQDTAAQEGTKMHPETTCTAYRSIERPERKGEQELEEKRKKEQRTEFDAAQLWTFTSC